VIRGVLNVNKPSGISSYDVIRRLKPVFEACCRDRGLKPRHTAVGHAGTLDPMATGVLLLLLGEATKASGLLLRQPKGYEADVLFGKRTDTDDVTGEVVEELPVPDISARQLGDALKQLTGTIQQSPPVFSALKQDGRPMYELARAGRPVRTEPRTVTIHELELLDWTPPRARLRCLVSSGTYVRSLARELGPALGTVATLSRLVRTRVGRFTVELAATPDSITELNLADRLVPIEEALPDVPVMTVDADGARKLFTGQTVVVSEPRDVSDCAFARTGNGDFLAIVSNDGTGLHAERVIYADWPERANQ